jgi:hypothetical protein
MRQKLFSRILRETNEYMIGFKDGKREKKEFFKMFGTNYIGVDVKTQREISYEEEHEGASEEQLKGFSDGFSDN